MCHPRFGRTAPCAGRPPGPGRFAGFAPRPAPAFCRQGPARAPGAVPHHGACESSPPGPATGSRCSQSPPGPGDGHWGQAHISRRSKCRRWPHRSMPPAPARTRGTHIPAVLQSALPSPPECSNGWRISTAQRPTRGQLGRTKQAQIPADDLLRRPGKQNHITARRQLDGNAVLVKAERGDLIGFHIQAKAGIRPEERCWTIGLFPLEAEFSSTWLTTVRPFWLRALYRSPMPYAPV